jgi:hypothetical protein
VPVVPVFSNGLLPDNLARQIRSNFSGDGVPIHTVFGAPVAFDGLLDEAPSRALFDRITDVIRNALETLGEEERAIRAAKA